MKTKAICLLGIIILATAALATPDSLRCRMIDWLDAPTNHDFWHYPDTGSWPMAYDYSGNDNWDLAMGDSFMVWLPGTDRILFLDSYETSEVDTIANFDYGSMDYLGAVIQDSIIYVTAKGGGGAILSTLFRNDSLIYINHIHTEWAQYHYAALEDSFLYTITPGDLTCINVADPESIFIYRTYSPTGANSGLTALDGYAYPALSYTLDDDSTWRCWPRVGVAKIDMVNSATPVNTFGGYSSENRFFGDLATDGEFVFYVNSEMGDGPDFVIGESDLFVLGTDTTYNFDSKWDGQGVFGLDVLNDILLAVGFEHGVSVLNFSNLDSIYEVAYYLDEDSTMDFTHFAMKESRIYGMSHPRDEYVRLYMFDVGDSVETGQCEAEDLPDDFRFWNYPNPFNSSVRFAIQGEFNTPLRIEIYDINGRRVTEILDSRLHGNDREIVWRPKNNLQTGVYFVKVSNGSLVLSNKVVYLK